MRKFFKYVFASMLGFVLAGGTLIVLFFAMLFSFVATVKDEIKPGKVKEVRIKDNTIYHLKFNTLMDERDQKDPFGELDFGPFSSVSTMGLRNVVQSIDYAAQDEKIKGIFMELSGFGGGIAALEEVRNALLRFKESGKFIVVHSEGMTQGAYYLSTVADKLYLYPQGDIMFQGLSTNIMYMKGFFDKLDIEVQAIKGPGNDFKSAVEPFTSYEMSDANRLQISAYLNSIWGHWLSGISAERGMSVDDLNKWADELSIKNAKAAKRLGMVDDLKYRDEVLAELTQMCELENEDDLKFLTYSKLKNKKLKTYEGYTKDKIAVIYANGEIRSGKSTDGVMGSSTIAKAVKKARKDTAIKAIVLRVNSPGGSALASDVMWRELKLAKAEKPLIISMGDLAASGGYYISCLGDKVYANESTITGSIGVFGMMPAMGKFFENKMGITFHGESTNRHSSFPNGIDKLDEEEYAVINESIIDIYEDFVSKVAEGRGMTVNEVKEVAKGRVWTGLDAKNIGLVDEIGDLQDAIDYAASQIDSEGFKIKELPVVKDPFEEMLLSLQADMSVKFMKENFGDYYKYFETISRVDDMKGVQARIPYLIDIR